MFSKCFGSRAKVYHEIRVNTPEKENYNNKNVKSNKIISSSSSSSPKTLFNSNSNSNTLFDEMNILLKELNYDLIEDREDNDNDKEKHDLSITVIYSINIHSDVRNVLIKAPFVQLMKNTFIGNIKKEELKLNQIIENARDFIKLLESFTDAELDRSAFPVSGLLSCLDLTFLSFMECYSNPMTSDDIIINSSKTISEEIYLLIKSSHRLASLGEFSSRRMAKEIWSQYISRASKVLYIIACRFIHIYQHNKNSSNSKKINTIKVIVDSIPKIIKSLRSVAAGVVIARHTIGERSNATTVIFLATCEMFVKLIDIINKNNHSNKSKMEVETSTDSCKSMLQNVFHAVHMTAFAPQEFFMVVNRLATLHTRTLHAPLVGETTWMRTGYAVVGLQYLVGVGMLDDRAKHIALPRHDEWVAALSEALIFSMKTGYATENASDLAAMTPLLAETLLIVTQYTWFPPQCDWVFWELALQMKYFVETMKRVHNFQKEVRRTAASSVNNLQELDMQMSGTLSIDTRSPIVRDGIRDNNRSNDGITDSRLQLQLSQSNSNSSFQGSDAVPTPIIIDMPSTSSTPQIQLSNPSPAMPIFHTNHVNHGGGRSNTLTNNSNSTVNTNNGNKSPTYAENDEIMGLCTLPNGTQRWFPGKVVKCNEDGTFEVLYRDGEVELKKPSSQLKAPRKRRNGNNQSFNTNNNTNVNNNNNNNSSSSSSSSSNGVKPQFQLQLPEKKENIGYPQSSLQISETNIHKHNNKMKTDGVVSISTLPNNHLQMHNANTNDINNVDDDARVQSRPSTAGKSVDGDDYIFEVPSNFDDTQRATQKIAQERINNLVPKMELKGINQYSALEHASSGFSLSSSLLLSHSDDIEGDGDGEEQSDAYGSPALGLRLPGRDDQDHDDLSSTGPLYLTGRTHTTQTSTVNLNFTTRGLQNMQSFMAQCHASNTYSQVVNSLRRTPFRILKSDDSLDDEVISVALRTLTIVCALLLNRCLPNVDGSLDATCCSTLPSMSQTEKQLIPSSARSLMSMGSLNSLAFSTSTDIADLSKERLSLLFTVREFLDSTRYDNQDNLCAVMAVQANLRGGGALTVLKLISRGLFNSPLFNYSSTDIRHIGKGAFGDVFRYTNGLHSPSASSSSPSSHSKDNNNSKFVVKKIKRERSMHDSPVVMDMFQEVRNLQRLRDSNALGSCYLVDFGIHSNQYWIVMENGLYDLLYWRNAIDEDVQNRNSDFGEILLLLMLDILAIVQEVHDAGIVHFDIKCANFIARVDPLTAKKRLHRAVKQGVPSQVIFLADFGESVAVDPFLSISNKDKNYRSVAKIQSSNSNVSIGNMSDKDSNRTTSNETMTPAHSPIRNQNNNHTQSQRKHSHSLSMDLKRARGTLCIQSPEMLALNESESRYDSNNNSKVIPFALSNPSYASDVWSLGLLLVEIFNGFPLMADREWAELFVLFCTGKRESLIETNSNNYDSFEDLSIFWQHVNRLWLHKSSDYEKVIVPAFRSYLIGAVKVNINERLNIIDLRDIILPCLDGSSNATYGMSFESITSEIDTTTTNININNNNLNEGIGIHSSMNNDSPIHRPIVVKSPGRQDSSSPGSVVSLVNREGKSKSYNSTISSEIEHSNEKEKDKNINRVQGKEKIGGQDIENEDSDGDRISRISVSSCVLHIYGSNNIFMSLGEIQNIFQLNSILTPYHHQLVNEGVNGSSSSSSDSDYIYDNKMNATYEIQKRIEFVETSLKDAGLSRALHLLSCKEIATAKDIVIITFIKDDNDVIYTSAVVESNANSITINIPLNLLESAVISIENNSSIVLMDDELKRILSIIRQHQLEGKQLFFHVEGEEENRSGFCSLRLKCHQLTAALHIACAFAFADEDHDNNNNNNNNRSSSSSDNLGSMSWLTGYCSQTYSSKMSKLNLNDYIMKLI